MSNTIESQIEDAKKASRLLASLPEATKNKALTAMMQAIQSNRRRILFANRKDLAAAGKDVLAGKLNQAILGRLRISEQKVGAMVRGIESVRRLKDPTNEVLGRIELDSGLVLSQVRCPIGLITVIFESRPDVVPQVMSLALKSGNSIVLKGGSEAKESNRVLFDRLSEAAYGAGVPKGCFVLLESRTDVDSILGMHENIDLIIPRGSKTFIRYIMDHTKIPVLGHTEGICHIYVDKAADLKKATSIILDAKIDYPSACNAVETILIHKELSVYVPKLAAELRKKGVEIFGCPKVRKLIKAEPVEGWSVEYGDLRISLKIVADEAEAILHINSFGSHHTDAIVTEDKNAAERFLDAVDSACVFHNCSTRLSDGYVFGKGAEIGISTNKVHARGPVGLDGLTIYKYKLLGNGHLRGSYHHGGFTHKVIR